MASDREEASNHRTREAGPTATVAPTTTVRIKIADKSVPAPNLSAIREIEWIEMKQ